MSKVVEVDGKTYIFMKGASEYIVEACDKIIDLKNNTIEPLDPTLEKEVIGAINHMAT